MRSGLGQHVDVAAQQSVAMATQSDILAGAARRRSRSRADVGRSEDGPDRSRHWCGRPATATIAMTFLFGIGARRLHRQADALPLRAGLLRRGDARQGLDRIRRAALQRRASRCRNSIASSEVVGNFTAQPYQGRVAALAVERGFLITPVTTIDEVVESPQFASRDYFQNVAHPELGESFRYPGPFAKFSATPIEYRRRPPTVGEHNSRNLSRRTRLERTRSRRTHARGDHLMANGLPLEGRQDSATSCG